MGKISENVRNVLEKVAEAAIRSGRKMSDITVVAVSKTRSSQLIMEVAEEGLDCFGENYVQEAEKKIATIEKPVKWHLVGHLQVNKAKKAIRLFDMIETVASIRMAQEISARALSAGKKVPVLVQVNIAEESSKWGVLRNDLSPLMREISILPGIKIKGLMTIPPYVENPEDARPFFISLREEKERINQMNIEGVVLKDLSMGMSHDYQVAIEEGATIIRIGTAIFGARER
jgi:pyridoxal phosphate enzyme (YggS family)